MSKYQLKKWRNPNNDRDMRIYLNGLETTFGKVWFERGPRIGTSLPPVYEATLMSTNKITKEVQEEIDEALSGEDLSVDKTSWEKLGKAADW